MGTFSYTDNEQHNFYYRPIYLLQMGGKRMLKNIAIYPVFLHLSHSTFFLFLFHSSISAANTKCLLYRPGPVVPENWSLFSFLSHAVALS